MFSTIAIAAYIAIASLAGAAQVALQTEQTPAHVGFTDAPCITPQAKRERAYRAQWSQR